jgi:hypothetical protein
VRGAMQGQDCGQCQHETLVRVSSETSCCVFCFPGCSRWLICNSSCCARAVGVHSMWTCKMLCLLGRPTASGSPKQQQPQKAYAANPITVVFLFALLHACACKLLPYMLWLPVTTAISSRQPVTV